MASKNSVLKPALIALAILLLLSTLIYWLWQRQPTGEKIEKQSQSTYTPPIENIKEDFTVTPKGNSVIAEEKIEFEGKTNPDDLILAYSNFSQNVTKANEQGLFKITLNLAEGLNQINFISLNNQLEKTQAKSISLYQDSEANVSIFYSGPVKNTFDTLLTLSTENDEQTIRQKSSTDLVFEDTIDDEDADIRVGDFVISLGQPTDNKDFEASTIFVIRQNKPKNNIKYIFAILTSEVKANIFSARDQKNANLVEFFLNSETGILAGGDETSKDDIVKNDKALILFHENEDNDNIANLIYLLP